VGGLFSRLAASQHLLLALLSAWLILTSPWVHMFRGIPRNAGFFDYSHVVLGLVVLVLAVTYTISCLQFGRWRLYFPWLAGQFGATMRELRALWRREIPSAEGGGLFGALKGLLLVTLLLAAFTGLAWLLLAGSPEAVRWRGYHIVAAQVMSVVFVLHLLAASLHLLEFVRQ